MNRTEEKDENEDEDEEEGDEVQGSRIAAQLLSVRHESGVALRLPPHSIGGTFPFVGIMLLLRSLDLLMSGAASP